MNLQEQIAELEAKENDILSKDTIDQDALNLVRNKLAELRDEAGKQQVTEQINQNHQDRVAQSMSSIANDLDNMEVEGFPLRTLFTGEGEYQLGRIAIQRWAENRESASLNTIRGNEESLAQLQRQNDLLQTRIKDADQQNDQLKTEFADAQQKRDAAARELADAQAQLAQLKAQNDELQKQVTGIKLGANPLTPEEQAQRAADEKEQADKLRRERYTVYDLKPDRDMNPTKYTAKRAFDNSDVEFPAFALRAYTVLTSDNEVQSFRTQYAQAEPVEQASVSDQPLGDHVTVPDVQPVDQFPATVQDPTTAAEMVREEQAQGHSEVVSRAEIDTINKRLDRLEKQAGLNTLEVA